MKKSLVVTLVALIAICFAAAAFADIVDASKSYCNITFGKTYSGNYNKGQPYDYVTISPAGNGETFAATGITIQVFLRNSSNAPLQGVPAQQVILFNNQLCICPGGNTSDAATDVNGMTTFSGTIRGGGCVSGLAVYADGVFICNLPVKINSPDTGTASPCFIDASDLASLATKIGVSANYNICYDYNESGPPTIDASDLAFFAALLGGACL